MFCLFESVRELFFPYRLDQYALLAVLVGDKKLSKKAWSNTLVNTGSNAHHTDEVEQGNVARRSYNDVSPLMGRSR